MTALAIFVLSYIGIALGRIPGLALDRVGISLLGAVAMVVFGVVSPEEAIRCIDFPTLCLLYSLMVISAQLRLGGFYTWAASNVTGLVHRPAVFLMCVMGLAAVLSAILANDIVCFAMTPIIAAAVLRAGRNAVPFLVGIAVASNIGSAATLIGNPQNMLIGQVGHLDFYGFLRWALIPSMISLVAAYAIILLLCRRILTTPSPGGNASFQGGPEFNRWQTAKGLLAVGVLVLLFLAPVPRDISAMGVAAVLLCSRKMKTREILGLVDWHLITLFISLFIIIHGISMGDYLSRIMGGMAAHGVDIARPFSLTAVSTVLSNVFSNVPASMLLMRFLDPHATKGWYILAVSSTFAGNLILLGSIANLIVVEKASDQGVSIGFRDHGVIGIPVTLVSLLILVVWATVL
jgi:Na+/H+ antiporter NhaD/arsenite permease-like protein